MRHAAAAAAAAACWYLLNLANCIDRPTGSSPNPGGRILGPEGSVVTLAAGSRPGGRHTVDVGGPAAYMSTE